jgi:hypothetical protein
MKTIKYIFYILAFYCFSCTSSPGVKVVSAKFVDHINANGVFYKFKSDTILRLDLNFNFLNDLAPDFEMNSEKHRSAVYDKIIEGAHFYIGKKEIKNEYGYWPKKTGKDFAKSMTIFYRIPKSHPENSLKFVYKGAILGDKEYVFIYTDLE